MGMLGHETDYSAYLSLLPNGIMCFKSGVEVCLIDSFYLLNTIKNSL